MSLNSSARILITGGSGFLGTHLTRLLRTNGQHHVYAAGSHHADLRDYDAANRLIAGYEPHIIFHLAANVGGIGYNQANPATIYHDNAAMGLHVLELARRLKRLPKVIIAGTVCAYPADTSAPFKEADMWNGYPEMTNASYGLAKRNLLVQAHAYRRQYGLDSVYLLLANLYGPGDCFDVERSHVIPALVRKFVEAKRTGVTCVTLWGTGTATREFLYVEDAARALLAAAETDVSDGEPVNVGTGRENSIWYVAECIRTLTEFAGEIQYDPSRPDGQKRRCLDLRRCHDVLPAWRACVGLQEGLARTVAWYKGQTA